MPPSQRVLQLQAELDQLQNQYAAQGGGSSSTVNTYYQMMRNGASEAGKSGYEKFIQQRNNVSAVRGSKGPNRADVMLLKDGLDMSLNVMIDDASRMRTNMTELGLALGEGRRAKIGDAIEHAAVPPHIAQQFVDQQRVLVEQRRLLEQLRQEKVQAETDQKWLKRENSNRYNGWNAGDTQTGTECLPVPPKQLSEAHALLRTVSSSYQAQDMQAPLEATAPQDGHLLVEFLSIAGFAHRQLYDARWEVRVSNKAGTEIAVAAADGPRNTDGTIGTRSVSVTIPAQDAAENSRNLDIHLILVGDSGRASCHIPFSEVSDTRGLARPFSLEPSGAWTQGSPEYGMEAVLCGVAPKDGANRGLAQTRVQKHGVTGMSRSAYPGPELPTSQAFLRQETLNWQRKGCPVEVDEVSHLVDRRPFRPAVGGPKPGGGIPIGTSKAPGIPIGGGGGGAASTDPYAAGGDEYSESGKESTEEEGGGMFFAGFREVDGGHEPEPMPQPAPAHGLQKTQRRRARPNGVGGFANSTKENQWMPPKYYATQAPPATKSLGAIAAFAGYEASASSKPCKKHTPEFAAFAGEQDSGLFGGIFSGLYGALEDVSEARPPVQVNLRPPTSLKSLPDLFTELRCAVEEGLLGTAEVAQDLLEFAARAAQPGIFNVNEPPDEADVSKYAGVIIDGLDAYHGNPVLTMWCVDALVAIFKVAGRLRSQIGVPLFAAFARASYNFGSSEDLSEVHGRLLAGLAATASPDCLASPKLVDYILERLESKLASMPPLTAEHALAVLCAIRSSHRIGTQIRHTLFLLRCFKSDPHLSTRMMVTLAELYEVIRDDIVRDSDSGHAAADRRASLAVAASGADEAATYAYARGVPDDGTDIRLAATVLDLYPNNRKVAGAAVRAFAAMSKLSLQHLQAVLVDELRGLSSSQRRHASSRSVNLHCAEVVLEAALRDPGLISKGAVLLVGSSQRSFPQDQEIAQTCVDALRILAEREEHTGLLLEAMPANELVKLGELHSSNARIMEPLLHLLAIEAFDNAKVRDELVRCSAVAVPLRALDFTWADASISAKALEAIKRLAFRSRDALRACHRAEGIKVVWSILERHQKEPIVVREALSAIAAVGKHPKARLQLVNIWQHDSLDILDRILHIAAATVASDCDILAQAALALGTLTASDDHHIQTELRKNIDMKLLEQVIQVASRNASMVEFIGVAQAHDLCQLLFRAALPSELYATRVLTAGGSLATQLPMMQDLPNLPDPMEPKPQLQRKADAGEQIGASDSWDIFGPLRALGVGKQEQFGEEPKPDEELDAKPEDEAPKLGFLDGGRFSLFG